MSDYQICTTEQSYTICIFFSALKWSRIYWYKACVDIKIGLKIQTFHGTIDLYNAIYMTLILIDW